MPRNILVIVSSHGELGGEPNGTYAPELTHALHVLEREGITYDLASPRGGPIPLYGVDADAVTREMLAHPEFATRLRETKRLAEVDADRYDGVFFPGGYGLLFDVVENADSLRITAAMARQGRPIAAVCHGTAALSAVVLEGGQRLVAGKHLTGFTREEEVAMKTLDKIPFLLEERMVEAGAVYRKKAKWQVLVVTDGALITGQNPGSATGVGEALAAALRG
ncbi:MAG: type 1 glutamine amidotransferase domain-containing protein [Deltaproteobacteria bacterium]|jgi:putative intracellular protease/amidase